MTCNGPNKKKKKTSKNKQLEFVMYAVAYVMFDAGKTEDEVLHMLEQIEYVAELFVDDYMSFLELRKVLKDEYEFELRFND